MQMFLKPFIHACAFAALTALPIGAVAAEIEVLATTALTGAMKDLVPQFEARSGHKVNAIFGPAAAITKRLAEGEAADVLIGTRAGLEAMVKAEKITAQSDAVVASSGIGVAVRSGAPKPDISTPEAFKQTLLNAKAISYSNPAFGGASGVHLAKVFEKLGIVEQMKVKTLFPPEAGLSGVFLIKGEADVAVQQFSELKEAGDVQIVGPLPGDLQAVTVFAAGVAAASKEREAAKAFVVYLRSPEAAAILKQRGLEP